MLLSILPAGLIRALGACHFCKVTIYGIKIPSPSVTKAPNALAHPFPFQIAVQTYEFILGVLFYAMVSDMASGEYVRLPNGLNQIETKLLSEGLGKKEWDRNERAHLRSSPVVEVPSTPALPAPLSSEVSFPFEEEERDAKGDAE
jgi:hypothetical protein